MPGGSTSRATLAVALLLANSPRNAANDFLFLPFDFGTAAAALLAAGSPGNDVRLARGWRLIGVAWLVSGIGGLLWLLHRAWPSSLVDGTAWIVYNAYYPLIIFGWWHFFERPADRAARVRLGVEKLIAVTATAVLAWYLVLRHNQAVECLRRVLSRQLSAAGFQVTEAADAKGALAALRSSGSDFDLLLTDVVMPGIRGDELARQVSHEFPDVKILCMSGTPAATASIDAVLERHRQVNPAGVRAAIPR